ncbi:MAG: aspartate-alanine antiporter, partial [Muribaculaceae bacterium]|nr:aspartate-alanine antiporter [Muribaculaceae bacterium]
PGPVKSVFFLLFLFAIGYSVGPQFFAALKGSGIKQVIFACIMCVICFAVTLGIAKIFHYNAGEASGLFAGAQTISAVIGVGDDTISTLSASAADKKNWTDLVPVCYAVTYIFGTIGSAYIMAYIAPMMLGGIKKVKAQTAELEKEMNDSSITSDPAFIDALRPVVFRAYKASGEFFDQPRSISDIEENISKMGRRIFVDRVRCNGSIIDSPAASLKIAKGDEVVLSGRREFVVEDESWIGPEVADYDLLSFAIEQIPVMVATAECAHLTVDQLRSRPEMYGVTISKITRGGHNLPVFAKTQLLRGDMITISGLKREADTAAAFIGYADRPTKGSDMVFVGLGIFIGALIGAITIHLGGIPVSLSTSGGALIAGLLLGWYRSRRPTFGYIPDSAVWILNNLGLNIFIAVIGITAAPTFISGIQQVGWMLFVAGAIATAVPLILGVIIGDKIFKFPPAINMGCCAGSRTTTATLGAIQDVLGSSVPALGYTVTYAIGNTLLILMGVAITLCCA